MVVVVVEGVMGVGAAAATKKEDSEKVAMATAAAAPAIARREDCDYERNCRRARRPTRRFEPRWSGSELAAPFTKRRRRDKPGDALRWRNTSGS